MEKKYMKKENIEKKTYKQDIQKKRGNIKCREKR